MTEPEPPQDDSRAFKRFMLLNLIRVAGAIIVICGIAVQEGLLALPPVFAYVLVILGFVIFFFVPNAIAKGWRSDDT
ncbi:MAG: hypothetical protein AAFW98_07950 [Pseudomonadota bacterium]